MRRIPHSNRPQRKRVDETIGSASYSDRFDDSGEPRSIDSAGSNGPLVDPLSEHSRAELRRGDPRAATGASHERRVGWSGFGPLHAEAVGRPARTSQTRAGRPPHHLAVRIYRALFLATLGCVGFAMFWFVLHLGSQ